MKPIIHSKLSSGSASHWKPREASRMAKPWMVLRMVRMPSLSTDRESIDGQTGD
jgi:hypothetical protein